MIPLVESLEEAQDFFLSNSSGSCLCRKDGKEIIATCYPEAEEFFNAN